jgi:uncharacterized protein (DUF4415 family)
MARRLWYDVFGIRYKLEVALELNAQLQEELAGVRKEIESSRRVGELEKERDQARQEVRALQAKLDKVAHIRTSVSEQVSFKKAGRPRISHVKKNFAVDLDTNMVLEMLHTISGTPWTRLVNEILRDWLYINHPDLYDRISSDS